MNSCACGPCSRTAARNGTLESVERCVTATLVWQDEKVAPLMALKRSSRWSEEVGRWHRVRDHWNRQPGPPPCLAKLMELLNHECIWHQRRELVVGSTAIHGRSGMRLYREMVLSGHRESGHGT